MIRMAFDIGGVLSKYPDEMRAFISAQPRDAVEVHVITDMQDRVMVLETLRLNGFGDLISDEHVHTADYTTHGEGCKAELLSSLGIHIFFDDFLGYVVAGGAPIRCLVMPDATRPYYHESWKLPSGELEFGRRVWGSKIGA